MNQRTVKPQDELFALYQTAHTSLDRIEAATGIQKLRLKRYLSGYSTILSIDELNTVRSFLTHTIRLLVNERDTLEAVGLADLLPPEHRKPEPRLNIGRFQG